MTKFPGGSTILSDALLHLVPHAFQIGHDHEPETSETFIVDDIEVDIFKTTQNQSRHEAIVLSVKLSVPLFVFFALWLYQMFTKYNDKEELEKEIEKLRKESLARDFIQNIYLCINLTKLYFS